MWPTKSAPSKDPDYNLLCYSLTGSLQYFEEAGFELVKAKDTTDEFVKVLENELTAFQKDKDQFLKVPQRHSGRYTVNHNSHLHFALNWQLSTLISRTSLKALGYGVRVLCFLFFSLRNVKNSNSYSFF